MPTPFQDRELLGILIGIFTLLTVSSLTTWLLMRRSSGPPSSTLLNLRDRVRSWWIMCGVLLGTLLLGREATFGLYAVLSFLALREFLSLTPTPRGDHLALFTAFFIVLPVHWLMAALPWYGMFVIFVPVYGFILLPVMVVMGKEPERFLTRTARLQWAVLMCVYFLSHLPMLLFLPIKGYEGQNAKLLLFTVLVTQSSDVLQYVFGKIWGKRPVAPHFSPKKTLAGLVGGGLTAVAVGASLWWATPFSPAGAAGIAAVLVAAGFFGGLVMSGVKRSLGVKDWGSSIPGHGGVLDRLDSLLFGAPLMFHLTGFYCATSMHSAYPAPEWLAKWLLKSLSVITG
jgi:phosphatidate cytidylyltransferase